MRPKATDFVFTLGAQKAPGRNPRKSARIFHNFTPLFQPPQKSTRIAACGVLPKIIAHETRRPRPSSIRAFFPKISTLKIKPGLVTAKRENQTG